MDRWLAVSTVARTLQVSYQAILYRIHAGQIDADCTPTGRYRISSTELTRLRYQQSDPTHRKRRVRRS